jgi:fucose 4-O-acetylase-like acetyltransferase
MPMPLACYLNSVHGSFFPLFPWMGFLFAGAYACIVYMKFRSENREEFYINRIMLAGIAAFAACTIILTFLKNEPSFEIKPDPFFFLQRLGIVFLALGLCWKYVNRFGEKSSYVTDVSRESLLIYFLHLQVIYRKVWDDKSIENLVNFKFGVVEALLATIILITSMIAVAKIWGSFKARFPKAAPVIVRLTIGISIILFFIVT